MKWTEEKTRRRGWGVKGVMEKEEREKGPQAIDGGKREGWNEPWCGRREAHREGCVWAEFVLNEEAAVPFFTVE